MKKAKLFLVLILMILLTASCGSSKEILKADNNLSDDKVLFIFTEYEYYEEVDMYYILISGITNIGDLKMVSLELPSGSEIIKNIEDPNALLLFFESLEEDDIYVFERKVNLNKLYKYYKESFKIKDSLEFEYNVLYGDYDKNYKNVIFGYSYTDSKSYIPIKYYSTSSVISAIKDEAGRTILENFLFNAFQ